MLDKSIDSLIVDDPERDLQVPLVDLDGAEDLLLLVRDELVAYCMGLNLGHEGLAFDGIVA